MVNAVREHSLRWLRHILRKGEVEEVRLVKGTYVEEKRGRERLEKR